MKKQIKLLIIFLFFTISLYGNPEIYCSKNMKPLLEAINQVPEGKALLDSIKREGNLHIVTRSNELAKQFGAYFDPDRREICLYQDPTVSNGMLIGSLLFELNNAKVTRKINLLDSMAASRKITKDRYVEAMEYLEYMNSHYAAQIADKGIELGVLPKDARLTTFSTFKEHYAIQKSSGHSAHFARNYDHLSSGGFFN
ncbi:MAG: hypothetical protein LW832_11130 [Parachlamydia sp.]|jgi:hypothetical protein|nr:hypothetical protein [Parachlamydia sp.]